MGQNRVYNEDLFTSKANEKFQKHIKTQSKRTLELVEEKIDWNRLLTPIEKKISKKREKLNESGRKAFSIDVIVPFPPLKLATYWFCCLQTKM